MIRPRIGYHFCPRDEEMLRLLRRKAEGRETAPEMIERDIYGKDATPWMIFKDDDPWHTTRENGKWVKNSKVLYVITRLEKMGNSRTVRTAGCGTWSGQTGRSDIKCGNKLIGFKKMFNFKADKRIDSYGRWIMHEYHLDGDFLNGVQSDYDHVICRIKWIYLGDQETKPPDDILEDYRKRKLDSTELCNVQTTESKISDNGFQGWGMEEFGFGDNHTAKGDCTIDTTAARGAAAIGSITDVAIKDETFYDGYYFLGTEYDDPPSLDELSKP